MKFGKHLECLAIEAWKPNYINYKYLKGLVRELVEQDTKALEGGGILPVQPEGQNPFVIELNKQLAQTSAFYLQKQRQCQKRQEMLLARKKERLLHPSDAMLEFNVQIVVDSLVLSFTAFGEELYALKQFADVNAMGFRKAVKKHNKLRKHAAIAQFTSSIASAAFVAQDKLRDMIATVEAELHYLEKAKADLLSQRKPRADDSSSFMHKLSACFCNGDLLQFEALITGGALQSAGPAELRELFVMLW